jgi:hypothetical protein
MSPTGVNLSSKRLEFSDYLEANDIYYQNGWTDGLPVIPPTPALVERFIAASGLAPSDVVGDMPERSSRVTAEKLAINAVMAGCEPGYMPVLVAAIGAIADPVFKFNHLASLGSPWPLVIVNGPITRAIGLNSGSYLFGPGHRANTTIARAISLVLANCAQARSAAIQGGQWGNPGRFIGVIAENETTPWTPLHVQRGLQADDSAVTIVSNYPNVPSHVSTVRVRPDRMLDAVCHAISMYGGAQWTRGMYTLMICPPHVDMFHAEGWTKESIRDYIRANTRTSIADLKYRGVWGVQDEPIESVAAEAQEIHPGDEVKYAYLFQDNGELTSFLFSRGDSMDRVHDVQVVVAGGGMGRRMALAIPYRMSSNPVTRRIQWSGDAS